MNAINSSRVKPISRREFVRKSVFAAGVTPALAAVMTGPFIRSARAGEPGANEKVRLGLIGCGGMGRGDLECFFLNPEVECAVICDVDDAMIAKGLEVCAKKERKKPDTVKDFRRVLDRKDVDVVLVATPDHWHALPTVMACQAGKDVYVEKPLAKTIDEGRAMLTAAQKHNRVVQMGSQWRSCQHIIEAAEFAKSGKLGKLAMVRGWAYLDWLPSIGKPVDCDPPAGADYDMWLGPAPKRAFNPNRFHFNFRWFWDYAGGLMTDWGVHLINMMLMGAGVEWPRTIVSSGGKYVLDDNSETPDSQVTTYEFPSFMLVWEHKAGLGVGINGRPWGISWSGSEGTILLNDEGWELVIEKRKASLEPAKHKGSGDPRPAHVRNFLACVKSRQQPVLNLELGHHVSTVAHLGNVAYRSGHKITWDAVNEKIVGDRDADKLVGVKYRKPWHLPYAKRACREGETALQMSLSRAELQQGRAHSARPVVLAVLFSLLVYPIIQAGESNPTSVPTFECLGLYWKAPAGAADKRCEVRYRTVGDKDWKTAMPLWFDPRNQEYRGSIVNLHPGTSYEVSLQLEGMTTHASLPAQTWSERFPVGKTVAVMAHSSEPLTISESGSTEGYVLYAPAHDAAAATIDVGNQTDHCVVIKASHVIVRGLTLKNARIHGILLAQDVHDVVIEGCDISGWGRIEKDGWGSNYDSAIYSKHPHVARIIIQRNIIHHPRSNSNNWKQNRRPGRREPSHPEGPQAICLWDSDGNHVVRYNTVYSDDDHQFNDIFGAGQNFSVRGFPNRDSDIYGNRLSHCWDDAIESEGANCNVRIWGNYTTENYVGIATASTSIGPLYVWRNVNAISRVAPGGSGGGFLKVSDKIGGGRIYVFHNTVLQPGSSSVSSNWQGAAIGLGWGGVMTNVTSRNNILFVSRQAIADRNRDPFGDYDYDLFSAPLMTGDGQEKHGLRGAPIFVSGLGLDKNKGVFSLAPKSPGFDAGVRLPNFNDGFNGAAPDIGAHEAGTAPMEFGTRSP